MQTLIYFILVPMVYIAFATFFIGTTLRLLKISREPKHPATLQIYPEKKPRWLWALHDTFLFPSVRRHKPVLWLFLITFHIGLLLLIIGHLELFGEIAIFQIIPHDVFLGQGYIGLILAISLLYFLFRRFTSPVRDLSVPEDYYLLILLFLIVIFGSEMDWARRWYGYEEMMVEDYQAYLWGAVDPETGLAGGRDGFRAFFHARTAYLFCQFVFNLFSVQPEHAFFFVTADE